MNDDIKAIRDALAAGAIKPGEIVRIDELNPGRIGAYIAACNPERICRLLRALEQSQKDAERYRWVRRADNARVDIILYEAETASDVDAAIDAAMKATP